MDELNYVLVATTKIAQFNKEASALVSRGFKPLGSVMTSVYSVGVGGRTIEVEYAQGFWRNKQEKQMDSRDILKQAGATEVEEIARERTRELWTLAKEGDDPEGDHTDADELIVGFLTYLGYDDMAEAWAAVKKWYG